jgi:transcriptional regulator of arginine metabolism
MLPGMTLTKDQRQGAIRKIVTAGPVGTQSELRKALRGRGVAVDQSTLSRDLVELEIRKVRGRYEPAERPNAPAPEPSFGAAVVRFTTCGPHLTVIRTTMGAAQPLAVKIDQAAEPSITATLAGDDTVFVATKNRRSQVVALRRLTQWFGDKHER